MNNDSRIVQQQIGRELRSDSEVTCRCHLDIPAVIKVPPKLNDGTPFPTTYWLTCPMYNKKIGSFLLSTAIKNAFLEKPQRVWVHTCSLDHKNALKNYIARGMKIFKKETVFV